MLDISCPSCRAPVHAVSGQPATCPACGTTFDAPRNAEIAAGLPRNVEQGIVTSPPRRGFDNIDVSFGVSKWRTTLLGLRLVWWSVLGIFLSTEALAALMFVNPVDPNFMQGQPVWMAIIFGFSCGSLIAYGLAFAGVCLCCSAPDATARGRAIGTIAATVLCMALALAAAAMMGVQIARMGANQPQPGPNPFDFFQKFGTALLVTFGVAIILSLAAMVSWILFHAAIGSALGNPGLRVLAFIVLAIWLLATPINPALAYIPPGRLGLDPMLHVRIQNGVSMALSVLTFGSYLLLCSRTMAALRANETRF